MFPFYVLIETGSLTAPNPEAQEGDAELNKIFTVLDKAAKHIIVSPSSTILIFFRMA